MRNRPSALTLLAVYAIMATFGLSYFFVRNVANQIAAAQDENELYSYQLVKTPTVVKPVQRSKNRNSNNHVRDSEDDVQRSPTFPIKKHIVTHGHPRTATTLLFNMAATSYFLYLLKYDPDQASLIHLMQWKREDATKFLASAKEPYVLKTHVNPDGLLAKDTVLFTAAIDRKEAGEAMLELTKEGHTVAFIQDMESLKESGVPGLVEKYVYGFGLSSKDKDDLIEYFSFWEILRQCCGQQMSAKWRNDMMPAQFKRGDLPHHPTCGSYDIESIEQNFMKSNLFSLVEQYSNMHPMNRPSLNDNDLNGTYCSGYNDLVRTQGLSIWGTPGGRPVRSQLDSAIKYQFNLGTEYLKPEGISLLNSTTYRAVWKYPEQEKKSWLETVEAARENKDEAKAHYETFKKARRRRRRKDTLAPDEGKSDDEYESSDVDNENEMSNAIAGNEASIGGNDEDIVQTSDPNFDDTHAIFLISFGKEAAESTLVERCVLSLRRRGAFAGYVIVLTDASIDRYQSVFDDHVIVMNPLEKHYLAEDGTPIKYSKENASLKYKRFKTFILDYFDIDSRLDSVDLVYYLDIDIMAGNTLNMLFGGVESKYGVLKPNEERSNDVSRAYFFTPLSKEWPLQGGTFILERSTSSYCLELWRREIDDFSNTERGRDQDALAKIYNRIQSGEETKCELVRMENENYLSLPTPRTFESIDGSDYPSLIHISNSVFAKRIDEEAQNNLIDDVLKLTEEERESGKYGKAVVHVD